VIDRLKNPNAGKPAGGGGFSSSGNLSNTMPTKSEPEAGGFGPRIEVPDVDSDEGERNAGFHATPGGGGLVRQRLDDAKNAISFLQQDDSKVLEFWQIWSESIPPQVLIILRCLYDADLFHF
jgi:hypothetical protein